jgi:integrase
MCSRGQGIAVPVDRERNRRIDHEEEARIVAVLERKLSAATTDEERAEIEGMILMFQLGLETCMRELYSTTVDQVRLECRSIFLSKTKNGDQREVPLGTRAFERVRRSWPALEVVREAGRIFPFWDGSLESEDLNQTTSLLSQRFSRVFREVGSVDLHFHDCRHEGLCRWVLEAPRPLSSEWLGRSAVVHFCSVVNSLRRTAMPAIGFC